MNFVASEIRLLGLAMNFRHQIDDHIHIGRLEWSSTSWTCSQTTRPMEENHGFSPRSSVEIVSNLRPPGVAHRGAFFASYYHKPVGNHVKIPNSLCWETNGDHQQPPDPGSDVQHLGCGIRSGLAHDSLAGATYGPHRAFDAAAPEVKELEGATEVGSLVEW